MEGEVTKNMDLYLFMDNFNDLDDQIFGRSVIKSLVTRNSEAEVCMNGI